MELKVTFRFDATGSFIACVDKFMEAALLMAKSGVIDTLPQKERGVTRAFVTPDEVRVDRKERVFPPQEDPAAPVEAEEPVKDDAPKSYTAGDVRAAMDRCRKRIEGVDYATDTSGEGYKKYHKQLTAMFKNEAQLLGADKPSNLPEDKRESFIDTIDKLDVLEDGTLGYPAPF